MVSSLKMLLII